MSWPFSADALVNTKKPKLFNDKYMTARCVDANQAFGRSQLRAGWKCLSDLDCHSKKCWKGACAGRLENEGCLKNIDCVSGFYCDQKELKCTKVATSGWPCTGYGAGQCEPGQYCINDRCQAMFSMPEGRYP